MTWVNTNSQRMIERERISGLIRGVDFGSRVFVIARAERPMLLWIGGQSYSVNGFAKYAESHLTIIRDRIAMDGWRNYQSLEPHGGRLTVQRARDAKDVICQTFGGDTYWSSIIHAIKTGQTLLIEGGGSTPQPHHSRYDDYAAWHREREKHQ